MFRRHGPRQASCATGPISFARAQGLKAIQIIAHVKGVFPHDVPRTRVRRASAAYCDRRRRKSIIDAASRGFIMTETLTDAIHNKVRQLTVEALKNLLRLKTIVELQEYILDRALRYGDIEKQLAVDVPIKGAQVFATRENLAREPWHWSQKFVQEVPVGADELVEYIRTFPLSAAAASYAFSIVEYFGDQVAELVEPGKIKRRNHWHRDVSDETDVCQPEKLFAVRKSFGKAFKADATSVSEAAARHLVELKQIRNALVHQGNIKKSDIDKSGGDDEHNDINLASFLNRALATVCNVAFLVTDDQTISACPWLIIEGLEA